MLRGRAGEGVIGAAVWQLGAAWGGQLGVTAEQLQHAGTRREERRDGRWRWGGLDGRRGEKGRRSDERKEED